jgi:hypothetical protein
MYGLNSENFFNGNFLSYDIDPSDESIKYYNKEIMLTYAEEYNFNIVPSTEMSYYLNNYGQRSDDFAKLDTDKHNVLFSGCSATFGDGLPDQFRWSKILYNELEIDNKGPYQCLSFLGGGSDKIVSNILKYCNEFGNPDTIFVFFNDFTRHVEYSEKNDAFRSKINLEYDNEKNTATLAKDVSAYNLFIQTQNYIRILEIYCKAQGIKLFVSCRDSTTGAALKNIKLNNFQEFNIEEMLSNSIKNPNFPTEEIVSKEYHKYLIKARDGRHDGIINNFLFKEFFIKQMKEESYD